MAKRVFVATVQLLLDVETEGDACDAMSEGLREWSMPGPNGEKPVLVDWAYLPEYGEDGIPQFPEPKEIEIADDYEEGEFWPVKGAA